MRIDGIKKQSSKWTDYKNNLPTFAAEKKKINKTVSHRIFLVIIFIQFTKP